MTTEVVLHLPWHEDGMDPLDEQRLPPRLRQALDDPLAPPLEHLLIKIICCHQPHKKRISRLFDLLRTRPIQKVTFEVHSMDTEAPSAVAPQAVAPSAVAKKLLCAVKENPSPPKEYKLYLYTCGPSVRATYILSLLGSVADIVTSLNLKTDRESHFRAIADAIPSLNLKKMKELELEWTASMVLKSLATDVAAPIPLETLLISKDEDNARPLTAFLGSPISTTLKSLCVPYSVFYCADHSGRVGLKQALKNHHQSLEKLKIRVTNESRFYHTGIDVLQEYCADDTNQTHIQFQLKEVSLSYWHRTHFFGQLFTSNAVKELDLSIYHYDAATGQALRILLTNNTSLESLVIENRHIGSPRPTFDAYAGFVCLLADGIRCNTALEKFHFTMSAGPGIFIDPITRAIMEGLASGIKDLGVRLNNSLEEASLDSLCSLVSSRNSNIESFNLHLCETDRGTSKVLDATLSPHQRAAEVTLQTGQDVAFIDETFGTLVEKLPALNPEQSNLRKLTLIRDVHSRHGNIDAWKKRILKAAKHNTCLEEITLGRLSTDDEEFHRGLSTSGVINMARNAAPDVDPNTAAQSLDQLLNKLNAIALQCKKVGLGDQFASACHVTALHRFILRRPHLAQQIKDRVPDDHVAIASQCKKVVLGDHLASACHVTALNCFIRRIPHVAQQNRSKIMFWVFLTMMFWVFLAKLYWDLMGL